MTTNAQYGLLNRCLQKAKAAVMKHARCHGVHLLHTLLHLERSKTTYLGDPFLCISH
jgi:hypothetical protein